MVDSEKRTVVEGVEFSHLFQFPRILRAVTAGFQPPRMVLGLLMIVLLITAGRVWDGVFGATVAPGGLESGEFTIQHADIARDIVRTAVLKYVKPGTQVEEDIDPREAIRQVNKGYADQRQAIIDGGAENPDLIDDLRVADTVYVTTIEKIEDLRAKGMFEATSRHVTKNFNRLAGGLIELRLDDFFGGLHDLFIGTPVGMWKHDRWFTICYGAFFVVVLALGGGALSRMAAVEIAHEEKLRIQEAVEFARRAWRRLIFSLLLPLLIAGGLSVLLVLFGKVLMLPYLDVLGGVLYGVALLIGCGVVFLLVGYGAGFSMLVPAVACENCDAADAHQRAYAYVLSRPLHLVGYGAVGFFGLALGFVVISLLAVAVLNVTGALVAAWSSNPALAGAQGFSLFDLTTRSAMALPMPSHSAWSGQLVVFWQTVIACLVGAYVFTNYFGASTIIYLLMRRACDGQDVSEIWDGAPAEEAPPQEEEPSMRAPAARLEADDEQEESDEEDDDEENDEEESGRRQRARER